MVIAFDVLHHHIFLIDELSVDLQGPRFAAERLEAERTVEIHRSLLCRRYRYQNLLDSLDRVAAFQQSLHHFPTELLSARVWRYVDTPHPPLVAGLRPLVAEEPSHPQELIPLKCADNERIFTRPQSPPHFVDAQGSVLVQRGAESLGIALKRLDSQP